VAKGVGQRRHERTRRLSESPVCESEIGAAGSRSFDHFSYGLRSWEPIVYGLVAVAHYFTVT